MTTTIPTTFTITAYGQSAGGRWPHFILRLDGQKIGEATVSSSDPSKYVFTADVPSDSAHRLQLEYDNDAFINGQDMNLFVKSFEVNGNVFKSTDRIVSYDKGALDGKDVVSGQEGMYWKGALDGALPASAFLPPSPTAGAPTMTSSITVNAWGDSAGGKQAHFKLLVDDVVVGDATVTGAQSAYTFKTDLNPDVAHKVTVWYDNDATVNGQDRNLYVKSVVVDGREVAATDSSATYDKGVVDGKYVVAGQEGLYWGGALSFGLGEEYFGGPVVRPAPAPEPVITKSTDIVVNASGWRSGSTSPHFKVLVDGQQVGEGRATSSTPQAFGFKADLDPSVQHKVQVWYDNDAGDRDLYVKSVVVNGHTIAATDAGVTYDKGAVDGKDVVKGQEGMYWGGALNVGVDAPVLQGTASHAAAPTGPAYFVATNGKDTWSGTLAAPNADGTDGPFASLERAQAAMRGTDVKTTYVREGTYHLSKTLEFTGLDNGEQILGYRGEQAVISGGQAVSGLVNEGNELWSAKLASAPVLDLTVHGVRYSLASKANVAAGDPTSGWYFADPAAAGASKTALGFHDGDVTAADLAVGSKVQVFAPDRLQDAILDVTGIDPLTHTMTFRQAAPFAIADGSTYRMLGNSAYVDQTGEYAWRAADGSVVFKAGAGFDGAGVEMARLGTLVRLNGATGMTVEGLTFANGTTDGSALELSNADGNRVGGNAFLNVGTAIHVTNGSDRNLIGGNALDHLAVHGILMDNQSNANSVYGNTIQHIGEVRKSGAGIMGVGVNNSDIAYNDIDHSARYGISLKNWSATTVNMDNTIEYNRVRHTGQETADSGGIEVLGRSGLDTNTLIRGNWVEHIGGLATNAGDQWLHGWKGFGVYLDDKASGVTVVDNFFKDTAWAQVMVHGGHDNTVSNNVGILGSNAEAFARIEWAPVQGDSGNPYNNTVTNNLVSSDVPLGSYLALYTPGPFVADSNFLHNVAAYGANDVTGDPQFVDSYNHDFHLAAASPVLAAGIHDLAWSSMGQPGYAATAAMPQFWDH